MNKRDINSEHLIRLVRKTPIIWDRKCKTYKNKQKTCDAWKKICKELRIGYELLDETKQNHIVQLVKKKWNNIRDHWQKYCRRIGNKQITNQRLSTGQQTPRKYVFYDLLHFLEGGHSSQKDVFQNDIIQPDCSTELCKEEVLSSDEISEEAVDESALVEMPNENSTCAELMSDYANNIPKIENVLTTAPNERDVSHEDRHYLFFQSIFPSLRKFTEEQTIDFQLEVLKLIRTIRNPSWRHSNLFPHNPEMVPHHQEQQAATSKGHVIINQSTPNNNHEPNETQSASQHHSTNYEMSESNF